MEMNAVSLYIKLQNNVLFFTSFLFKRESEAFRHGCNQADWN